MHVLPGASLPFENLLEWGTSAQIWVEPDQQDMLLEHANLQLVLQKKVPIPFHIVEALGPAGKAEELGGFHLGALQ
jgi:hypothetical protein